MISDLTAGERVSLRQRFWANVKKGDGCWEWQACRLSNGYGMIGNKGKGYLTHRVSWELTYGDIPEEQCVLHHCDNRSCVRPDHLFLGTRGDNARDMVSKGRHRYGVRINTCKLTEDQVRQARMEYRDSDITVKDLAIRYGVSITAMSFLLRGKNWSSIPDNIIARARYNQSGEKHPRVKLTALQVKQIRDDVSNGIRLGELATRYKVTAHTISDIALRKTWKDLP